MKEYSSEAYMEYRMNRAKETIQEIHTHIEK